MLLTADMQRLVREQRLAFVATVRADGAPSVSPKGTIAVLDDEHLMFADIVSPGTIANVERDGRVDVNVVDPIARRGYRFRGIATVHRHGDTYDRGIGVLVALGSTLTARVRAIVAIHVDEATEVRSPAYDHGAIEDAVVARWLAHHTELHARPHG